MRPLGGVARGSTPVIPFEGLASARSICWTAHRPKAAPSRCSVAPTIWPPLCASDGASLFAFDRECSLRSVRSACHGLLLRTCRASGRAGIVPEAISCLPVPDGDTGSPGRRRVEAGTREGTARAAPRLEESSTMWNNLCRRRLGLAAPEATEGCRVSGDATGVPGCLPAVLWRSAKDRKRLVVGTAPCDIGRWAAKPRPIVAGNLRGPCRDCAPVVMPNTPTGSIREPFKDLAVLLGHPSGRS
jgi:hypothetical protein